jgi:alkylhydroperoxidase family enzyme
MGMGDQRVALSRQVYSPIMAWVTTGDEQPDLPNILKSHSANKPVLRGHLALYRAIMFGESGLTRAEREALAVVVSNANDCYY